ncbi:hypothetical protein BJY04DRAFT_137933 [Aspergillus karnatakaensis]|uniref:uncharacterized protein n=1 Tax=Aspergillus karnatakaensis TaxID=1810916 RepID=UPI003CCCE4AD
MRDITPGNRGIESDAPSDMAHFMNTRTAISSSASLDYSGYEQEIIAELVHRLNLVLRSQEVSPGHPNHTFAQVLYAFAASSGTTRDHLRLNHIHVLGELPTPNLKLMERDILQCGKKLRLHSVLPAQCSVNIVLVGANPFIRRDIEAMQHYLHQDKAIASTVVVLSNSHLQSLAV